MLESIEDHGGVTCKGAGTWFLQEAMITARGSFGEAGGAGGAWGLRWSLMSYQQFRTS